MLASSVITYLEDLAAAPDLAELRRRALRAGDVIPGSTVNFNEVSGDGAAVVTVAREERLMEPAAIEAYLELRGHHPVIRRLRPGQDSATPVAISQLTDEAAFRATPLYQQLYRQLGMLDQLLIAIPRPAGTVSLAIGRTSWGFTRRELYLAGLLQRVLRTVYDWQAERERLLGADDGALAARLEPLTARQAEVMRGVLAGRTNAAVAAELGLSARTVEKHLEGAYRRLGVRTRAEATALLLAPAGAPGGDAA